MQQESEALGVTANISFRVNPNVDAKTHPYISTGLKDNKFGVSYKEALALYRRAQSLPNIRISGIDCHVGSQITQIEPFIEACRCMLDIVAALKSNGITLDHIDFGRGPWCSVQPGDAAHSVRGDQPHGRDLPGKGFRRSEPLV